MLDAVIIALSVVFVVIELATSNRVGGNIISILQAIFRFFRIFLLIRKAQTFKKIKNVSSIKTPAEKIIEFLLELKELTEDVETQLDLEYCIEKIASSKLYEPTQWLGGDGEASNWINQYRGDG